MSIVDTLNADIHALETELQLIPVGTRKQDLDDARARFDKAVTDHEQSNGAESAKERSAAETELIRAKNMFEMVYNEADTILRQIAEKKLALSADNRISEAHSQLALLRHTTTAQQNDIDLTDAALARLETMKADVQSKLGGFAEACADQLLIDAGLPGAAVSTPKSAEVAKAQQELASIDRAIGKAQITRMEHTAAFHITQSEAALVHTALLDATADKMTTDHAAALSVYLPHLAAMRSAEFAAHGTRINPLVDVEYLAASINVAASQTEQD